MSERSDHEEALNDLACLLSNNRAYTAQAIAKQMKCSKPTAYARVNALEKQGFVVARQKVRAGASGPMATAYMVVGMRK